MERYKIDKFNDFAIEGKDNNIDSNIQFIINNLEQYINTYMSRSIKIKLSTETYLTVNGNSFITFSEDTIIKPLCQLLNVPYSEIDPQYKIEYYSTRFNSQITKLITIKSEEELLVQYPKLYAMYIEKKRRIESAITTEVSLSMVKPIEDRERIKSKQSRKNGYTLEEHYSYLSESRTFGFIPFIQATINDLSIIMSNFPSILCSILNTAIDTRTIKAIDQEKVADFIASKQKNRKL